MSRRALLRLMGVVTVALTAGVPSAGAADLWTETGRSLTSVNYWQGITFDAATRTFTFDGPAQGLWRTDAQLARLAGRSTGIPSTVTSTEGWNHLGDLSFDAAGGPRLLVPLECYYPAASDPNMCHSGDCSGRRGAVRGFRTRGPRCRRGSRTSWGSRTRCRVGWPRSSSAVAGMIPAA